MSVVKVLALAAPACGIAIAQPASPDKNRGKNPKKIASKQRLPRRTNSTCAEALGGGGEFVNLSAAADWLAFPFSKIVSV